MRGWGHWGQGETTEEPTGPHRGQISRGGLLSTPRVLALGKEKQLKEKQPGHNFKSPWQPSRRWTEDEETFAVRTVAPHVTASPTKCPSAGEGIARCGIATPWTTVQSSGGVRVGEQATIWRDREDVRLENCTEGPPCEGSGAGAHGR